MKPCECGWKWCGAEEFRDGQRICPRCDGTGPVVIPSGSRSRVHEFGGSRAESIMEFWTRGEAEEAKRLMPQSQGCFKDGAEGVHVVFRSKEASDTYYREKAQIGQKAEAERRAGRRLEWH